MLSGDDKAVVHRQYKNVINRKVQHHLLSKKAVFVLKPQPVPSVKDIGDWRVFLNDALASILPVGPTYPKANLLIGHLSA